MSVKRWWDDDASEQFWLEITDRSDLGVDLNAPLFGGDGHPVWHYDLVDEVRSGDIVFHYHKAAAESGIVAVSLAVGEPWQDNVTWASHTSGDVPRIQPGRRQSLSHFTYLDGPLTLDEIRSHGSSLRAARDELVETYGSPLYGPFELGQKRPVRPSQAYLTRMPAAFVEILGLNERVAIARQSRSATGDQPIQQVGLRYVRANEQVMVSDADPFKRDPVLVEKSLRTHWETQNALSDRVVGLGWEPRRPSPDEPRYDLAWEADGRLFVAEVKSIKPSNEESQLRLGLGQLQRYLYAMSLRGYDTAGVLAVNRRPSDKSWEDLLDTLSIRLTWARDFDGLI